MDRPDDQVSRQVTGDLTPGETAVVGTIEIVGVIVAPVSVEGEVDGRGVEM